MPFDLFDDLFERNDRKRYGRRSGFGGLLDRVFGGDRHDDDDDRARRDYERARSRRDDDDDDRRAWRDGDQRRYDRTDDRDDDHAYGRRRRDRDADLFDFD